VGNGAAIGNSSPFAIDDTTTDEWVYNANISNVNDGVNLHVNDGNEPTLPDEGTNADQVLEAAIPGKKPSSPMEPEPEVP
jgi:hypothetical protein